MRCKVNIGLIQKRIKCISSNYNYNSDCQTLFENALGSIESKPNSVIYESKSFMMNLCCKDNANKFFPQCLGLISEVASVNVDAEKSLVKEFTSSILPYIDNMDGVLNLLNKYNISNESFESITEACKSIKICDRITRNHALIQEKFDLEKYIVSNKKKDLSRVIPRCCKTIYEFDSLKPNAKLNVCLEELSYILQKKSIKYNEDRLVKYVVEYFLNKPGNNKDIKDSFRKVLSENTMISDKSLYGIKYFIEENTSSSSIIITLLNKFKLSETKDLDSDFGYIIRSAPIGHLIPRNDFINNLGNLLEFIRVNLTSEDYDIDQIIGLINTIQVNIESEVNNQTEVWRYTRPELDTIVEVFLAAVDILTRELDNCDIVEEEKYMKLKDCYMSCVERINDIRGLIYTEYNLQCMSDMFTMTEAVSPLYLNEFKLFKFQNLISAAIDAEKLIKTRAKKFSKKLLSKINLRNKKKLFKDMIFKEAITAENNIADICVASFDIISEDNFYEVHDEMTDIIQSLNKTILYNTESRAYYVVKPDAVEIHVENVNTILLDEDEMNPVFEECLQEEDKERILNLEHLGTLYESTDFERMETITKEIIESMDWVDSVRASAIIEATQYLPNVDIDNINTIKERYFSRINIDTATSSAIYNWKHENAPIEIQIEAFDCICSLLESDNEKKKINNDKKKEEAKANKEKDQDIKRSPMEKIKDKINAKKEEKDQKKDEKKKNPKSGFNPNNLKLYVQGLKAKMKDMSAKEKEWSRNIDMNFSRLSKGMHDALISDRREAIIKGSVIPSFSKCIKIGIALAGLTFINPVASAVVAIGGFAMSKSLTKKERILLLDEIETELEVVDKEIENAESAKNMKKYRKLLTYKKDLQRQYQRIKYNIRVGKDILPGSAVGVPSKDK